MTRGQTSHRKSLFLAEFRKCGNVTQAAHAAEIDRKQHYAWLDKDKKYFKAFTDAEGEAADLLEKEAHRRAVLGVDEPVFYLGKEVVDKVGNPVRVKKYSDPLLVQLLKANRPEKFRERYEVAGAGGGPVRILVSYEDPPPAAPKENG